MFSSAKKTATKFVALCATVMIAFALCVMAGCSAPAASNNAANNAAANAANTAANTVAPAKDVKIAIVQLADNDAFAEMATAFKNEMAAQGFEEGKNATYDMKSAQGDASTLNSICSALPSGGYDLICSIVTPATQAVVNADVTCPVVFISVTDPVGAGIMSSMETPDKNATGTSNVIPVSEIFGLANELTPDYGTVGLLYCSGEKNASLTITKAKAYLDEQKIAYEELPVASSAEVQQAAEALAGKCGMIYIPVDSTVQSAMPQVVEAATNAGIPVYGSDPVMVKSGCLGCISVSNTQLGARSAQMAAEILNGTDVAKIPAEALTQYAYVLNGATAEKLNITLPEGGKYIVMGK